MRQRNTMIKKFTGVTFTPDKFREMMRCHQCGIVSESVDFGLCKKCELLDLKKCKVCECLLRDNVCNFYTYDIKENKRENGVEFKVSKEVVREFIYKREPMHLPVSDSMCSGCVGWEERIKDFCFLCDAKFPNTEEHYKLNGNMCQDCVLILELTHDPLFSLKS